MKSEAAIRNLKFKFQVVESQKRIDMLTSQSRYLKIYIPETFTADKNSQETWLFYFKDCTSCWKIVFLVDC